MRILPDVNVLAIQLIEDHPGHPYVSQQLVPALEGDDTRRVLTIWQFLLGEPSP